MNTLNYKGGSFMPATKTTFAVVNTLRSTLFAALICVWSLLSANWGHSQGLTPVEVNEYLNSIQYMGMSGDTMKFRFSLGDVDAPVVDAAGFLLDFTFPKLLSAPSKTIVAVEPTWLTAGLVDPEASTTFDPINKALTIDYVRSDEEGQSGYGTIIYIALVRSGGFDRSEASMYLDGGVIMVDNLDVRLGSGGTPPKHGGEQPKDKDLKSSATHLEPSTPGLELTVYPNPASDYVDVQVAQPKGAKLSLWNLDATLISEQACEGKQRIDLRHLPSGSYLLKLESAGDMAQRIIVKQ
jgi:Secretion system C-terminal sorting domain